MMDHPIRLHGLWSEVENGQAWIGTDKLWLKSEGTVYGTGQIDDGRHIGAGLSRIDAGLRLRYEIVPEFAPSIGVVYGGRLGQTARLAAPDGDQATQIRFVFGIRSWF